MPIADINLLEVLPFPALVLGADQYVAAMNTRAEEFFVTSLASIKSKPLSQLTPPPQKLMQTLDSLQTLHHPVSINAVDFGKSADHDVTLSPVPGGNTLLLIMTGYKALGDPHDKTSANLKSVGAMAEVLAHEIKNPLAGIKGAAQLIALDKADDMTTLIIEESDRISRLLDDMHALGRPQDLQQESVNLHEVLDHAQKVAETSFAASVRFVKDYDPSLPSVMGHRDSLVQVFLNLIKNATEAMEGVTANPEIRLISRYRAGWKQAGSKAEEKPLLVSVQDNGPGIHAAVRESLFDAFASTKSGSRGLGLALAMRIITDHKGDLTCQSESGKTIFTIALPLSS